MVVGLTCDLCPHLAAQTVLCLIEGYLLTGILSQDSSLVKQRDSLSVGTVGICFLDGAFQSDSSLVQSTFPRATPQMPSGSYLSATR